MRGPRPRHALLAGLLLAGTLASGCVVETTETRTTTPTSGESDSTQTSPSPTGEDPCPDWRDCRVCPWKDGCPIPESDADPHIEFVLNDSYNPSETVTVRITNVGSVPYEYRTFYAACDLEYYTNEGRRFLIPPGTHCDIANEEQILPGESKDLFAWDLDECTDDQWGCAAKEALAPGRYHVRGTFEAAGESGLKTTPGATFRILDA